MSLPAMEQAVKRLGRSLIEALDADPKGFEVAAGRTIVSHPELAPALFAITRNRKLQRVYGRA